MSKPRTFSRPFSVRLQPLDLALLNYYADKHGTEAPEALRLILRAYAKADKALDLDDLARYVARDFSKRESEPEAREAVSRQVDAYVEARRQEADGRGKRR